MFNLVEAGYYNVVRTDVRLYHYESVSRGYDAVSPEKAARQQREMKNCMIVIRNLRGMIRVITQI